MCHIVVLYSWSIFIWIINKFTYYYVRWKVSCYCIIRVLNNYSISHKLSICLDWAYFLRVCGFFFFFFWCTHFSQRQSVMFMYCSWDPQPLYSEKKKKLKMSLMTLFTYLKIILLQCFQFSVFSKISCIQMDLKCLKDSLRIGSSSSLSFFFSLIISFRGGSNCRMQSMWFRWV